MPAIGIDVSGMGIGEISLEVQAISSEGGPDYPILKLPVELFLSPLRHPIAEPPRWQAMTLLEISGWLFMTDVRIGNFRESVGIQANDPIVGRRTRVDLNVALDPFRVNRIEYQRKGDLALRLSLGYLVAVHSDKGPIERFEVSTARPELSIVIPRSHWVQRVLPGLGYGKIELVELPIPASVIPGTFTRAAESLQKATEDFIQGLYDESVAKCRHVIQLIAESKPVQVPEGKQPSFPKRVDLFVEQHLVQILTESKRKALGDSLKTLWNFTSIPHHPVRPGYFNRHDAELCLRLAAALLSYSGKILA